MATRRVTGNYTLREALHKLCREITKYGVPLALAGAPDIIVTAVTAVVAACQATGYDHEPKT